LFELLELEEFTLLADLPEMKYPFRASSIAFANVVLAKTVFPVPDLPVMRTISRERVFLLKNDDFFGLRLLVLLKQQHRSTAAFNSAACDSRPYNFAPSASKDQSVVAGVLFLPCHVTFSSWRCPYRDVLE
jgi:hypothetical protein